MNAPNPALFLLGQMLLSRPTLIEPALSCLSGVTSSPGFWHPLWLCVVCPALFCVVLWDV
ncbi:hypothetical protein DL89DRAFT_266425, partial [Linderina pennispora]